MHIPEADPTRKCDNIDKHYISRRRAIPSPITPPNPDSNAWASNKWSPVTRNRPHLRLQLKPYPEDSNVVKLSSLLKLPSEPLQCDREKLKREGNTHDETHLCAAWDRIAISLIPHNPANSHNNHRFHYASADLTPFTTSPNNLTYSQSHETINPIIHPRQGQSHDTHKLSSKPPPSQLPQLPNS